MRSTDQPRCYGWCVPEQVVQADLLHFAWAPPGRSGHPLACSKHAAMTDAVCEELSALAAPASFPPDKNQEPTMTNVAVISAQWGDEGRARSSTGCPAAPVVVRFQAEHNAGHTLVIGGVEYKLSRCHRALCAPASCR